MPNYTPTKNKAGELAYLDTFGPLIKCKVIKVYDEVQLPSGLPRRYVQVKVTVTAHGYKRGEVLTCEHDYVVPRDKVRVRGGKYRIITSYEWQQS